MPKSFETKESAAQRLVSIGLIVVLLAAISAAIYVGVFVQPPEEGYFSSAELRRVVERYREQERQALMKKLEEIESLHAQMKQIRDRWITEIEEKGLAEDPDRVLETEEVKYREAIQDIPEDMEFHEIHQAAQLVEQDMITMYREFRAASMVATVTPNPLYEEEYDQWRTPRPDRPELNQEALYREVTSREKDGPLDQFLAEIKKGKLEMVEMHDQAEKLLAFARKSDQSAMTGQQIDLSSLKQASSEHAGPTLQPDELEYGQKLDKGSFNALPGRRFVGDGSGRPWMYVDQWWIIGPFPADERRLQLDVKYGPEAEVNLDDVFTGKDGQKITWKYKKLGYPGIDKDGNRTAEWLIKPGSSRSLRRFDRAEIYYAYTEIYSDRDRKVWFAMGSDDYGKLWVNDELVWVSDTGRKPINVMENMEEVSLKPGQNKVLMRVENGGGDMGWILCAFVYPEEQ